MTLAAYMLKVFVKCGNVVNLNLIGYADSAPFLDSLIMNWPELDDSNLRFTHSFCVLKLL